MSVKKFGYARVSSKDQNPERQIQILKAEGIDERDIYVEKKSGREFSREVYRMVVDQLMREGDMLVVTELKRFGRNYNEIYHEWYHITKEKNCDIKVTSMPILDTSQSKELLGQLITDIVLSIFAYVADEDWTERHELQRQGIEVAKDDGKHLGRPQVEFPENWMASYDSWKNGRITARAAMKEMNLKKDSFYRLVKKYEQS
ncbi:MAG: recombinase family protein [Hungatella hathewayi]|uniref:recombinase family protein n=1 Tax=Hungatella TaxID=1649459 RepID=UPI0011DD5EEA|nr:recombinase family protein [Hungatella hathewayi]MDU4971660.1 recombinase family protein [Hungatella hathewayi]